MVVDSHLALCVRDKRLRKVKRAYLLVDTSPPGLQLYSSIMGPMVSSMHAVRAVVCVPTCTTKFSTILIVCILVVLN